MEIPVQIVRAFTANEQGGNPAGVVLDAERFSPANMQKIASQAALSETVFVDNTQTPVRTWFFTPTQEVDLCGHGSLATWSILRKVQNLPDGLYKQVTKAGTLEIELAPDNVIYMQQPPAEFADPDVPLSQIIRTLGLGNSDQKLHPELPPQIVSTGLVDLFVPVRNEAIVAGIEPNFSGISKLSEDCGVEGVNVFALLDRRETGSIATARMFAPLVGIPEEAATGSATGALLYYLKARGKLTGRGPYRVEQGRRLGQLSHIYGVFREDRVWIGGTTHQDKTRILAPAL